MLFHFFLGKGGVGRSTLSFHFATQLAQQNPQQKILFIEFESQGFISYLLKNQDLPQVHQDFHCFRPNFYGLNLVTEQCLKEYLTYRLKLKPLVQIMMHTKLIKSFFEAAPGLDHMSKLGKIYNNLFQQYTEIFQAQNLLPVPQQFDQVVVDFAATGHGLYAIDTPRTFEKLFPFGSINQDAQKIARAIENPQITQFHLVTLLDELPVIESIHLSKSMKQLGLPITHLWLNQALIHFPSEASLLKQIDPAILQNSPNAVGSDLFKAFEYEKNAQLFYGQKLSQSLDLTTMQLHQVSYESLSIQQLRNNYLQAEKP